MVSRVGLGLAALGRPGYINLGHAYDLGGDYDVEAMEARAHAVLDDAWAAGVRYFDAARSYGRAEAFLASWLEARGIASDAVVGSKWGYVYTAGWKAFAETHEVKDHSPENLRRQWGESRATLGDRITLYQIHSATIESGVLEDLAVVEELARMKGRGVRVGLSLSGPRQGETLRRALSVSIEGGRLFDCVQATWNVLEPSAGDALAEAHAAGLGVIVKEAMANGRLSAWNDDSDFTGRRAVLESQAKRLGTGLDGLALAAVLARPWADVVLSGAATCGQLGSNLGALAVVWDDEAEAVLAGLAEEPRAYWTGRSRMAWT